MGSMRTWGISLNGQEIGEITSNDFYKLELWPGTHQIDAYIKTEKVLGILMDGKPVASRSLNLDTSGQTYALGFDTDGSSTFVNLASVPNLLENRRLAGFVPAGARINWYKVYGGNWEGPVFMGKANGEGRITWKNGAFYTGLVNRGSLTPQGILTYPNGDFYQGRYNGFKPYGVGTITAKNGDVLYAGYFNKKGQKIGRGIATKDGVLQLVRYLENKKVDNDPASLAISEARNEEEKILDGIQTKTKSVEAEIASLENAIGKKRREFERAEQTYPERCHCVFNLCLTSTPRGETSAQRAARRAAIKKRNEACHAWRAAGGTREEREAKLEQDLEKIKADLKRQYEKLEAAKREDSILRAQKQAELEKSRAERIALHKQKIEAEQLAYIKSQREWCEANKTSCGCLAFVKKKSGEIPTCSK